MKDKTPTTTIVSSFEEYERDTNDALNKKHIDSVVAVFHLRNFKVLAVLLVIAFASCTKHNDVQFTTFGGQKAAEYTVQVEAQQSGAPSIWSPISSITIPQ